MWKRVNCVVTRAGACRKWKKEKYADNQLSSPGRENFRGKWIVTKTAAFHCGKCSNSGIGLIPDRINAYKHVKTKLHGGRSWILMARLWSWIAMLDGVYTPAIWITFMSSIIRVSTSFNRFAGSVSQTGTPRDSHPAVHPAYNNKFLGSWCVVYTIML